MKNRQFRVKIFIYLILICSFVLFVSVSYSYFFKKVGYFLVLEQIPQKADVIVVLNGRDTERSLTAVDLYNKGYSNLIVMARGGNEAGGNEFLKRIKKDFDRRIFFQKAIEAMGIPENSFMLIGDGVASTYDEAIATKQFLKNSGYKSILLVTSKWHSKRAYLTFKSVLRGENGIRISVIPSRYDTFNPEAWWRNESEIELVLREYVRLIYYLVTLRISLFT